MRTPDRLRGTNAARERQLHTSNVSLRWHRIVGRHFRRHHALERGVRRQMAFGAGRQCHVVLLAHVVGGRRLGRRRVEVDDKRRRFAGGGAGGVARVALHKHQVERAVAVDVRQRRLSRAGGQRDDQGRLGVDRGRNQQAVGANQSLPSGSNEHREPLVRPTT